MAIHLELMMDMSTKMFLFGLRRFVARHGSPQEIISDTASHFKLSEDTIESQMSSVIPLMKKSSGNSMWN